VLAELKDYRPASFNNLNFRFVLDHVVDQINQFVSVFEVFGQADRLIGRFHNGGVIEKLELFDIVNHDLFIGKPGPDDIAVGQDNFVAQNRDQRRQSDNDPRSGNKSDPEIGTVGDVFFKRCYPQSEKHYRRKRKQEIPN